MVGRLIFSPKAWDDYLEWQRIDKQIVKRINAMIKDCQRTPFSGLGKPEALKGDLSGSWSRRIDDEHRLLYVVTDETIEIAACRGHYTH